MADKTVLGPGGYPRPPYGSFVRGLIIVSADIGTLTLSGQNVTPIDVVKADVGALSLSGQNVTPVDVVRADVGTLSLSGQNVTPVDVVRADVGVLTFNGQNVNINEAFIADVGALSLSGQNVNINKTFIADVGALSLTGQNVTPIDIVNAGIGALSLTGQNVDIGGTFIANVGALSLTGQNVDINETFIADVGALTFTGQNVTPVDVVRADVGTLSLSGQNVNINKSFIANVGALSLSGQNVTVVEGQIIIPTVGALTLSGLNIIIDDIIITNVGALTFSGQNVNSNESFIADVGALSLSGQNIIIDDIIITNVGALTFSGQNVAVDKRMTVLGPGGYSRPPYKSFIKIVGPPKIYQLATEILTNINVINTDPLKLCLPFNDILGESFTEDGSLSKHPIDMTTGGLPTIESSPAKFGGGAADITTTDWLRILLPQPDFNFTDNFTIEFWIYRNTSGATEDIMGQWPSTANKSWRIQFVTSALQFEWTSDGSTVNTENIPFDIPISTWTHVVFENFGTIFTVYINGLAKFFVPSITPLYVSNTNVYVGKIESSTGGEEFDGSIDGLKIIVGQAIFQAPFLTPTTPTDCSSIIPPNITWNPGNLGILDECDESLFQIIVNGIDTVAGTQEFQAIGLPNNMTIDAFGNIIGTVPTHTPAPNILNYPFSVTFLVGGIPILGPNIFSFDVQNIYSDDILQITIPTLFEDEDRTSWKTHLLGLIPFPDIFRPTDPNFGIIENPDLFVIDGITDSSLISFQNAITAYDSVKHEIIFDILKIRTNENFDILYYSIVDTGSTVITFPNPLNILPDPIEPISIDNIRDSLIAAIGFDSLFDTEVLPDWLPSYEPLVIAAYVEKGKGQAILDKFNSDTTHHIFKGKIIKIDRLNITRCSTFWDENGKNTIMIKFDDI